MSEKEIIEDSAQKPKKPAVKKTATKKTTESLGDLIVDSSIQEATQNDEEVDGQKIITGPAKKRGPRASNMQSKDSGVVSSRAADHSLSKIVEVEEHKKDKKEKVAVWSDKNIRWTGTGTLSKGYNIVNKEAAEKWLKREGIREATPEEVATHYGK